MTKKLLLILTGATLLTAHTMAADVSTENALTWDIKISRVYSMMTGDMKIMPVEPYEITQQRYVYTGTLPSEYSSLPTYKSVTNLAEDDKLKEVIASLKINEFDLSALKDTTLTNLSLKENKENWFVVSLDFEWGYLSVYRNYSSSYYQNLNNQAPIQRLSDEEALKIANDFIEKYKINVSKFGTPYVENDQQAMYAKMSSSMSYVNPYIQIVFPTQIDWKNVNERYGQNAWLRISISSQSKSIEWFSVKIDKFVKTDEAKIITDSSRIAKIIEKWGYEYENNYISGYTVKYQDIKLTNARIEYVKVDTYINSTSTYYAPALIFDTVKSENPDIYIQDKIIVPLIDKAYETDNRIMY